MASWLATLLNKSASADAISLVEVAKPQMLKKAEQVSHKSTDCISGQLPANALLVDWPEMQSNVFERLVTPLRLPGKKL